MLAYLSYFYGPVLVLFVLFLLGVLSLDSTLAWPAGWLIIVLAIFWNQKNKFRWKKVSSQIFGGGINKMSQTSISYLIFLPHN